jgi:hypothetical protein
LACQPNDDSIAQSAAEFAGGVEEPEVVARRRGSAAPEPSHNIGLRIDDDVQAAAAELRRRGLAAQGLDEARAGGGLRVLAKLSRVGLAEKPLGRLGFTGVGPRAGAGRTNPAATEASATSARPARNPRDMPFPL